MTVWSVGGCGRGTSCLLSDVSVCHKTPAMSTNKTDSCRTYAIQHILARMFYLGDRVDYFVFEITMKRDSFENIKLCLYCDVSVCHKTPAV